MYVLDTNTVGFFMRGAEKVVDTLLSLSPSDVAIPSIVLFELRSGLTRIQDKGARDKRLTALNSFLEPIQVLPFDANAALAGVEVFDRLTSAGRFIGPHDLQIAATTLSWNAVLATSNTREFDVVPNLRTVDWLSD